MRHFLAVALAPLRLTSRMTQAAAKRLLVALAGPPHAVAPRLSGARRRAISLAVIAAPAHPQLLLTARTVPHPVTDDVDRTNLQPQKAGRGGPIRSWSAAGYAHLSIAAPTPRRPEEVSPRAFTFCGAASCYRAGDRKKTRCAPIAHSPEEVEEEIESDPRSRWIRNLVNDSGGGTLSSPDFRTSRQPFTYTDKQARDAPYLA